MSPAVDQPVAWRWLGQVPYDQAHAAQRVRRDGIVAGTAAEALWLLEHPSVITTGRRPVADLDRPALAAAGIPVVSTERGGLATWHGPGQLVVYPLVNAVRRGLGARALVAVLEDTVITWLASHEVDAGRREGLPGVWVGRDKICAVGLHLAGGVCMHGLALNLGPDLSVYSLFSPCGVRDGGVTSLLALTGSSPTAAAAATTLGPALSRALIRPRAASRSPAFSTCG